MALTEIVGRTLVVACFFLCLSCAGAEAPVSPTNTGGEPVRIHIEAAEDSNQGSALHVLIRSTTRTDYPRDEYDTIAATLELDDDPQTLKWVVVMPGQTCDVLLGRPESTDLGIYFLFSHPGRRWKDFIASSTTEPSFQLLANDVGRIESASSTEKHADCLEY